MSANKLDCYFCNKHEYRPRYICPDKTWICEKCFVMIGHVVWSNLEGAKVVSKYS